MPLQLEALLPLAVLLLAAAAVHWRRGGVRNGWVASVSTALAGIIALVELLELAPGEHVDVFYLPTFPFADVSIRLDGLSLSFATLTLLTAAFLMVVRQWDRGDRRDPWVGWLLTSAAAVAVILAANLLLLYILLQVLTLAWSGALDETARRQRRLRLTLQVADIGLLLAAAGAIQSVGTSSYSGVPSDTFGVASFWLMLLPVTARIAALLLGARRPRATVAFGPAIAWLAPAAYILMRLLALMGGRLPDRPTAVILFGIASAASILFALAALMSSENARRLSLLLAAQAALALALSSGSEPLLTVASSWMWLLLIPLAGLASVRSAALPDAEALTRFQLSMIPASMAFTGVWLAALTLNQLGLLYGVSAPAVAIVLSAAACLRNLKPPRSLSRHPITVWAVALLLVGAFPIIALDPLVIPTATTVRPLPAGTVSATPLGLATSFGDWPALPVWLVVVAIVALGSRLAHRAPTVRSIKSIDRVETWNRLRVSLPRGLTPRSAVRPLLRVMRARWSWPLIWGGFAVILIVALSRP